MCADRISFSDVLNVYGPSPQMQECYDELINDCYWETRVCHRRYKYPAEVQNQKCWAHVGVFYKYLIRREVYVLCNREAVDKRAELYASALKKYRHQIILCDLKVDEIEDGVRISINRENIDEVENLLGSYEIFKNTAEFRTVDVLKHIFKTSMLRMMSKGRPTVPYHPDFLNRSNINDVLGFVKSWNLRGVEINPTVSSNFFTDDADLIFHDCIMDIRTSKNEPEENRSRFNLKIYKMIFYALGYFSETGRKRRKFKVYNPLLGKMYILNFKHFDFDDMLQNVNTICQECLDLFQSVGKIDAIMSAQSG